MWVKTPCGQNQLLFILFHQFYWSYIQDSLYKSFKITRYYKNSLQFSSDCTNTWTQETIFTNTYAFL